VFPIDIINHNYLSMSSISSRISRSPSVQIISTSQLSARSQAAQLREKKKRRERSRVASDSNPDMQSPIGKIPRILESPQKIAKRQLETSLTQSSWQQRYLHLIQKQQALSHHHHQNSHYFTVPEYDSIRMQLSLSRFHLMTQHAARDSDGSMLSNCNTYACLTPGCVLQPLNKCPANILNDANGERIPSSGLFTVPFVPRREHSLQLTNASGDVSSVQSIILDDEKGAYSNVFSVLVDGSSFSGATRLS
jgi:hypothetical protein